MVYTIQLLSSRLVLIVFASMLLLVSCNSNNSIHDADISLEDAIRASSNNYKNKEAAELEQRLKDAAELKLHEETIALYDDSMAYAFINSITPIGESNILYKKVYVEEVIDAINFVSSTKKNNDLSWQISQLDIFGFSMLIEYKDTAWINQQITKARNKHWNLKKLNAHKTEERYKKWQILKGEYDWSDFKKEGFGCHIYQGIPIFNKEQNVAIIYQGYMCGHLLGFGMMYKYELKNGKWEKIDEYQLWIS